MSYVYASDIGCQAHQSPWDYYNQGPDTMFLHPQSVATSGKTGNIAPAATQEVGQAFYAEQVRLGGWTPAAEGPVSCIVFTKLSRKFFTLLLCCRDAH